MTKHIFETHTNCHRTHCEVCDGGLSICTVCGLIEGSLTTDCPEKDSWLQYGDAVYAGEVDFRDGKWVSEPSPQSPRSTN
jgi:hypothetical protein